MQKHERTYRALQKPAEASSYTATGRTTAANLTCNRHADDWGCNKYSSKIRYIAELQLPASDAKTTFLSDSDRSKQDASSGA